MGDEAFWKTQKNKDDDYLLKIEYVQRLRIEMRSRNVIGETYGRRETGKDLDKLLP